MRPQIAAGQLYFPDTRQKKDLFFRIPGCTWEAIDGFGAWAAARHVLRAWVVHRYARAFRADGPDQLPAVAAGDPLVKGVAFLRLQVRQHEQFILGAEPLARRIRTAGAGHPLRERA